MNETKTSCAPADSRNLTWDGMDWSKCCLLYTSLKTRAMNPADDIYQSDSNFQFSPFRFPTYSVYL